MLFPDDDLRSSLAERVASSQGRSIELGIRLGADLRRRRESTGSAAQLNHRSIEPLESGVGPVMPPQACLVGAGSPADNTDHLCAVGQSLEHGEPE